MARISGKGGKLYVSLTAAGNAEPVANIRSWSIDQTTDTVDVTALGDSTKVFVQTLPNASGQIQGFFDDASASNKLYTAATAESGSAKKFYLYPGAATDKYWSGTAYFAISHQGAVDGAVEFSATWVAASSVIATGI